MSIAGSDPSGGAGIQADLKTFHQFGVYGEAVLTLLTVQNTCQVERVESLSPELVEAQIRAVIADIPPAAAKTGALGNAAVAETVARLASGFAFPLVVDPVMISKHGQALASDDAVAVMRDVLAPRAFLITPNIPEASALAGMEIPDCQAMREAARRIHRTGACHVLVKGGHREGPAVDILYNGRSFREFTAPRLATPHTHGTGCTFSAAITALLARGRALEEAVARAKQFITEAIRLAPGLGRGAGPVYHHAAVSLEEK